MTIASEYAPVYVTALAGQTDFEVTFPFNSAADLTVYVNDVLTTAWSLSGTTVVRSVASTSGDEVYIERTTPITQTADYTPNDKFPAETHESALDKLTRIAGELRYWLGRTFSISRFDYARGVSAVLPDFVANKILQINATADGITFGDAAIITVTPDAVSGMTFAKATTTLTPSGGEAVLTASSFLPASSIILGVTAKVTTGFGTSNGLSSVDIGDDEVDDRFGNGIAIALNTVTNVGSFNSWSLRNLASAGDVHVHANGGAFDATGAIKLTVHYLTLTPDS